MSDPKILIFDLESAPTTAYVWGLWQQNVGINQIKDSMYILDWSAKWLDDQYVYSDSLHWHKLWKTEPTNDRIVVESAWKMFDEADYIVGHNIDGFDIKTMNARFLTHGMPPPSPYRTIDTLKIARRTGKFTSNKLDYLAQVLGVGEKVATGGFSLWADIIDKKCTKAFDKMVQYCENDVWITESVFKKLRPWDKRTINIMPNLDTPSCPSCGSDAVTKRGFYRTATQQFQQYNCKDCGHNSRSLVADNTITKEQRSNLLKSN